MPRSARLTPLLLLLSLAPASLAATFVDRSDDSGIDAVLRCGAPPRLFIPEGNGSGGAWLDYDDDGDLDFYLVNGNGLEFAEGGPRLRRIPDASNRLYRNDGGWRFADVTDAARVGDTGWGNGAAVADVNEDGHPDLYVANFGADVLYVNQGDGTFADETAARGLGHEGWSTGAAFADVDRDGDLDLFVPCYVRFDLDDPPAGGEPLVHEGVALAWGPEGENPGVNPGAPNVFWWNEGDGTFREATEEAGLRLASPLCSYGAVFCDVDGDGWQDLAVTNDVQPNSLFRNRGGNSFEEVGEERGFARGGDGKFQAGMGIAVADVNGDAAPDLFVTNFDFEPNNLYVNNGQGWFRDEGAAWGTQDPSMDRLGWGCGFFDAELDGDLDLFVANGHVIYQSEEIGMSPWKMTNQFFETQSGAEGARFLPAPAAGTPFELAESSRGAVFGDPDNDGDVDVIVVDMDAAPQVLENRTERRGRWLTVELTGTRSPRDAYGSRIDVTADGRTWTAWKNPTQGLYSSHDPRVHFGLGEVTRIERVRVLWTSGTVSEVRDVAPDAVLSMTEPPASTPN